MKNLQLYPLSNPGQDGDGQWWGGVGLKSLNPSSPHLVVQG